MNIAIFTDSFFPQINGLVTAIDAIATELSKRNNVYVFVPAYNMKYSSDKYTVIKIPSLPFILAPEYKISSLLSIKVIKFFVTNKIDIIHTHTPFSLGILGLLVGKLFNIPVVHTYHTLFEEYLHYVKLSKKSGSWIVKLVSRLYCNRCDKIIVPSAITKDYLKRYSVKKEITVMPTGINLDKFKNGIRSRWRKRLNIPDDATILLYVGRLAIEKNIFFLLECFAELYRTKKNLYFLIVGGGPLKKEIEFYLKKNRLNKNVIMTGYLDPSEMKHIYAASDIFIFASVTETEGLVILEAIDSGLPVVAVAERGTKTLLPSKKILGISPVKLDKKRMINEIQFYLKNRKKYKKTIKNNLKNFIRNYTIQTTAKHLSKLYNSLIDDYSQLHK